MQTKLSSKGQLVLPHPIRRKLGLRSGDTLDARIEGAHVVLTPRKRRLGKGRIIRDPITGMAVFTAGPGAPILTSKQIRELLSEFQ
jgi:AbrB family looped-hinge helix DNA binding protein